MALAVTGLVVVAFSIPLALAVRNQAETRAVLRAEQQAQTAADLLGLRAVANDGLLTTTDAIEAASIGDLPIAVVLADGSSTGEAFPPSDAFESARTGRPARSATTGGDEIAVPVVSANGTAVVRVLVTNQERTKGVARAMLLLAGLAVVLIAGAVFIADRLGQSFVAPTGRLAAIASELGQGNLETRAEMTGPPEVAEVAGALNTLADRVQDMLAAERESVADLSHRLRTPLTGLRLQIEGLPDSADRSRLTTNLERLEREVNQLINLVRGERKRGGADLARVVRQRGAFWSVLAAEQDREVVVNASDEPLLVPVTDDDLGAMIDALVGNVFAHTEPGVAFSISAGRNGDYAELVVADVGPGFPPGEDHLERGTSSVGSTGLGLDIVRRTSEQTGGGMETGAGPGGGARISVRFGQNR